MSKEISSITFLFKLDESYDFTRFFTEIQCCLLLLLLLLVLLVLLTVLLISWMTTTITYIRIPIIILIDYIPSILFETDSAVFLESNDDDYIKM